MYMYTLNISDVCLFPISTCEREVELCSPIATCPILRVFTCWVINQLTDSPHSASPKRNSTVNLCKDFIILRPAALWLSHSCVVELETDPGSRVSQALLTAEQCRLLSSIVHLKTSSTHVTQHPPPQESSAQRTH